VTQKAWRVLQVLGALFGQRQESEADTKATLDRISQITQVLDVERGVVVMVM
jgi:hypothetical protein